jgi:hypothetical protein
MLTAIVCGGRDYTNAERVDLVLDEAVKRLGLGKVIEGECPTPVNPDKLSRIWAEKRGIPVVPVPAETVRGKFQGPARNQQMLILLLREPGDKAVFAFPSRGTGTAHMCRIAEQAGVTVYYC